MHHPIVRCPRCTNAISQNGAAFVCTGCGAIYPFADHIINFLHTLPLGEQNQLIQSQYDDLAATYDGSIVSIVEGLGCPWSTYTEIVEEVMHKLNGKIILNVGCGTSFPVACFLSEDSFYFGLDLSMKMLGYSFNLMNTGANVSLLGIDVERIPLPDGSVDACIALFAFNIFQNPIKASREINRVLIRRGDFFATVPLKSDRSINFGISRSIEEEDINTVMSSFSPREGEGVLSSKRIGDILFLSLK